MLRYDRLTIDIHVGARHPVADGEHLHPRAEVARDIRQGPGSTHVRSNCCPVVADFLAADLARVERRKAAISEREWQRTGELGQDQLIRRAGAAPGRDALPDRSTRPLTGSAPGRRAGCRSRRRYLSPETKHSTLDGPAHRATDDPQCRRQDFRGQHTPGLVSDKQHYDTSADMEAQAAPSELSVDKQLVSFARNVSVIRDRSISAT